jgi:hypothetical protein
MEKTVPVLATVTVTCTRQWAVRLQLAQARVRHMSKGETI